MNNSNPTESCLTVFEKQALFVLDKVQDPSRLSLSYCFNKYFKDNVEHGSINTRDAKKADIEDFLKFYMLAVQIDAVELWTPSVTKGYIKYLKTERNLKPTSINRKLATLRHASSWMEKLNFISGSKPFDNVQDLKIGSITWKGLSDVEIMRLKSACDKRMSICTKKNQNPLLETTIFYLLLHTGLRESELCELNYGQYKVKYFEWVQRKGNKVSERVTIPPQAREYLEQYITTRGNILSQEPMLINKNGNRLKADDVYQTCRRIAKQANAMLKPEEHVIFTPHSLRHAFLKRVADKLGLHVAQELSGNVSMKEIYRYTRPSFEETEAGVDNLFD